MFEAFVERWLRAHLPHGLRLDNQFEARLDEGGQYVFKIDLIISDAASGKALAVLDTKYKRAAKASTEDLQQIIAYSARMEAPVAFLVYPSTATERQEFALKATAPSRVVTTMFDLAIESDAAGHRFLEEVLTALPKAGRVT